MAKNPFFLTTTSLLFFIVLHHFYLTNCSTTILETRYIGCPKKKHTTSRIYVSLLNLHHLHYSVLFDPLSITQEILVCCCPSHNTNISKVKTTALFFSQVMTGESKGCLTISHMLYVYVLQLCALVIHLYFMTEYFLSDKLQ